MTTPSLKPAMPAGGILTQHVDQDFADFHAGRPLTQRVLVAVVQAGGTASENQERGRANKVKYESLHLVEVTDPHEADRLRHLLTTVKAERGFLNRQPALFDATDEEQRESLIDMIRDWASETNTPMSEVDQAFVDYFGGGDNASAETVQACRSVVQLKEYAYHCGAFADGPADGVDPTAPLDEFDGFGAGDPEDGEPDDEPLAGGVVPFQAETDDDPDAA